MSRYLLTSWTNVETVIFGETIQDAVTKHYGDSRMWVTWPDEAGVNATVAYVPTEDDVEYSFGARQIATVTSIPELGEDCPCGCGPIEEDIWEAPKDVWSGNADTDKNWRDSAIWY